MYTLYCIFYMYADGVKNKMDLNHTRYVTKMKYLPLGAQAMLYLCLLQLARDGHDVGRVVVVCLSFALVLVLLLMLLRWCLMAAVLVFIVIVDEDYAVSTQIQALASPVAWFPPHGPIGERSAREQPLTVDGVLPISIVRSGCAL